MALHQQVLMQCTQRQLNIEKNLQQLAQQELVLVREKQEHENQYDSKDVREHTRDIQRELSLARLENDQLRLDGLRQRKQNSILRLKLASAKEDVDLLQRNIALLNQHSQRLVDETVDLRDTVSNAQQQLTAVSAAKAVLQAEASKQQREALRASMEATQLREDLKLATGRLNTATGQAADLLQQLKSVQAENASLMGQLALSQGRDAEAAAAHTTLQQALEGMRGDLTSLRERLAAEETARVATEAAGAKSAAAAAAAADALAVKEQQMAAWKDLEQASKATASQQMQLTQVQLDSMHQRATATETKLLDQIAALQQQLSQERAARSAAEANNTVAVGKAAVEQSVLEKEVAALRQQVSQVTKELAAARSSAAKEAKRAAALQQDLEHLQEQVTRAAEDTMQGLVEDLTQGQDDTEDDSEQLAVLQRKPKAGSAAASKLAVAAAAKRKQGKTGGKAATNAAAAAVAAHGSRPAAELSEIEEGDEEGAEDVQEEVAKQQPKKPQHQQPRQQQQHSQEEQLPEGKKGAGAGGRRPSSAKSRAKQPEKVAAIAEAKSPSPLQQAAAATGGLGQAGGDTAQLARRVSPRTKAGSHPERLAFQPESQPRGPGFSHAQQQHQQGAKQEAATAAAAAAAAAGPSRAPPPLGFALQSVTTPAAALKSTQVMNAAAERLSAASMLKKLNQGVISQAGKPGARKRKLGAAAEPGSMDVLPSSLIMSMGFKPPKVRHMG